MDESRKKLDALRWKCLEFNGQVGMDLMKLWRACDKLFTQCDIAAIECRRKQRLTVQYKEAQTKFYTALESLEKRITFAHML